MPEEVRTALGDAYEVLRPLGQGGMGTVYLAREIALDRLVAVKVLRSELAGDDRNVQRFLREARVAAKLRHPGIVSIHAVGSRGGCHFFTMDFLEGHTLDAWTKIESPGSGRVEPGRARSILADVASAVGQAHQHGIVHRDLKPSNIMLDSAGRIFVMDFGLARPRGSGELTTAGAIVGTPQYMSPEQIDGKTIDPPVRHLRPGSRLLLRSRRGAPRPGRHPESMVALHLSGGCRARLLADARVPESERASSPRWSRGRRLAGRVNGGCRPAPGWGDWSGAGGGSAREQPGRSRGATRRGRDVLTASTEGASAPGRHPRQAREEGVAAAFAIVIGLAAGVYPALRASRLTPVDAIRAG